MREYMADCRRSYAGMRPGKALIVYIAAVLFFLPVLVAARDTDQDRQWIATWGASPLAFRSFGPATPPGPFANQTIRQTLRISAGGDQIRVRFSNEIGTEPLSIGAATVAVVDHEATIRPASLHRLSFGGRESIVIPPGAPALSDPVDLAVDPLSELAVSIFLPRETPASTMHMGRTSYLAAGDQTGAGGLGDAEKTANLYFLTGVYVRAPAGTGVIVALGDSITDGAASTPYTYNSWPHHLARRLAEAAGGQPRLAVINHGISGNQLLRDGAGPGILARFDRDVLSTPGLTHIVVLIGINDIGTGGMQAPWDDGPAPPMRTVEELIAGYEQLIARARSRTPAIRIYGATLTPFEGAFPGYYSPEKEPIRAAVNEWIRTSGRFDGVVDFDLAVRDPEHPNRMLPEYDSGDKLHPGDAGYRRMAESVDLELFGFMAVPGPGSAARPAPPAVQP